MIKVVIIDDDYLVRINLKMMIDWEAYGLTIVGEAENGQDGLELIKSLKPDFAIIDVQMPNMGGVELSQQLDELGIQLYYIMLSNYDEYEYVRGAMKNGAKDFLLKHKLNQKSLTEQVEYVVKALSKKHQEGDSEGSLIEKQTEEFMMNLLVGEFTSRQDMEVYLNNSLLSMGLTNVIPVIVVIDGYQMNMQEKGMDYVYKLRKNVCFLLKELLQKHKKTMFLQVEDNKYVLMISFEDYRSELDMNQIKDQILHDIRNQIEAYYNESVTFSVGNMVSMDRMKDSYGKAYINLGMKFYLGNGKTIDDHNASNLVQVEFNKALTKEKINQLKDMNTYATQESIEEVLNDIFMKIQNEHMNRSSALNVVSELLDIVEKVAIQHHIPSNRLCEDSSSKTMLRLLETADEFYNWLKSMMLLIHEHGADELSDFSDVIRRTIVYIRQYYQESISLSSAAEHIGINNSYLSKVFKDEVGLGFNQFLCQERIQCAKGHMRDGLRDFKEIARICGFNNYSYFFKVFKKNVGKTPKQYIASLKK